MSRVLGTPLLRVEDPRLLTGRGRFVGDLRLPGMLHAAFVRSPHAHARIARVDAGRARGRAALVLAAGDLGAMPPIPVLIPHPAVRARTPAVLARERVRYVGEPVAMVVAADRYLAEDLADLVEVEYEPLPAVVDPARALEPGAPLLHPDLDSNLMARVPMRVGDPAAALRGAAVVVRARFEIARCSVQALEPRAVVADPTGAALPHLTVWLTTQSPHRARAILAGMLGMPETEIRVVAPDVGGGFGAKNRFYAEYPVVALAALRLGAPVAWIGDRHEDFTSTYQERAQDHEWEMGLDAGARIVALRGRFTSDNGAYDSSFGMIPPLTTAITVPGPYRVPNYEVEVRCVYTNKTPLAPYRGAGRQQGIFVMERLMDLAARETGVDPADLRLRNLIQPHELPYDVGLQRRDGRGPVVYDSGDYPAALRLALDRIGYRSLRDEHARLRGEGRYRGVGLACYVEMAGLGAREWATVRVDPSGAVFVFSASASQGQGHETTWAQVCAERLGVPVESVRVVVGDTGVIAHGTGTFASRSAVAAGNAVSLAALRVREKALRVAAGLLEASPDDLVLDDGRVGVRGAPARSVPLAEVARAAAGAALTGYGARGPDETAGLEATAEFDATDLTYGYGTQVAEVEVDPERGAVTVLRYLAVHDCGREYNPLIVEGQVIGGIAQGLGNALFEETAFDGAGQPLAVTYLDYLLPTADAMPPVEVLRMETPAPGNPEGVKGVAEGGTIPVPAAVLNAVEDALAPFGARFTRVPLRPEAIVAAARGGR